MGRSTIDIDSKCNIHESKDLLCIWWNMKDVVYYKLKPNHCWALLITINQFESWFELETFNNNSKKTQNNFVAWQCSTTQKKCLQKYLKILYRHFSWRSYHTAYLSDCVPSNYFDQCSMVLLTSTSKREEIRKWLAEWIASKDEHFFFIAEFTYCQKSGKKL